ncbi:MAG: hypothetical protein M1358_02045 [Chloroflexi bacterium]|nr:hypothetical protein [Chloroflexota bacterium]
MGKLRVMSSCGDKTVSWDEKKAAIGDSEALEAVKEAERILKEEQAKGATVFRIVPGQPAERIKKFDETVEQIVVVPRIAGG